MPGDDFAELSQLAADLGDAPKNVGPFLRSALQRTAFAVKKDAAKSVSDSEFWRAAAASIDYDSTVEASDAGSTISVDIGYNKGKPAGALGNLREYGAPEATYGGKRVPLAPRNDLKTALGNNESDFERGIERALDDALKKSGL